MKYILYRSLGDLDKAVKKHELVAVETGKNIDDVLDILKDLKTKNIKIIPMHMDDKEYITNLINNL